MWLSGHAGSAAVVSRGDVLAVHWLVGPRRTVTRHAVSATTSGGFYFAKPGLDNAARRMHMCCAIVCRGGVTGLARQPRELSALYVAYPIFCASAVEAVEAVCVSNLFFTRQPWKPTFSKENFQT